MVDFTPPPRARFHCRRYSYSMDGLRSVTGVRFPGGPRCAIGILIPDGGALKTCCPEPSEACVARAEWTDEERAAYTAWGEESRSRLIAAIMALPAPIPLRSGGWVKCPNCGGQIRYDRWERGAELNCSTPYCCGAHFSIAPDVEWPQHAQ